MDCFEYFRVLTVKENAGGFSWGSKLSFEACLARSTPGAIIVAIPLLVAIHSINIFSILLFADDTALVAKGKTQLYLRTRPWTCLGE